MFIKDSFLNLEEEMNNRRKSHENCNLKSARRQIYIGWMAFMNSRGNKKPKCTMWVGGCVSCMYVSGKCDWATERPSDRATERPSDDWVTKRLSDWATEWPNDWATERLSGWATEWMSDWVTEWPSDWVTERLSDWVTEKLIDWVTEFK